MRGSKRNKCVYDRGSISKIFRLAVYKEKDFLHLAEVRTVHRYAKCTQTLLLNENPKDGTGLLCFYKQMLGNL